MGIKTTGVRYDLIGKDSVSKTFDSAGRSGSRLEKGLGRLGKAFLFAGAAAAGGLAVGLAKSAKDSIEFESKMKKVQTQAGGTAKDVSVLSGQILKLSAQQGPAELADSMYHLKSIGLDNVSAMKDLRVSSDLAAVGQSNLEETTNALGGAWRSGIKGAETFGKSAASVNAIIGAGNMRMEDFVSAIGTGILPTAKSFGLSLNSVGSALALMTDEGIPAVDSATRLRMSISLLGAPSQKAEKQLKRIGLTGTDLAKKMRSPAGLVGTIGLLKTNLDKSGLSAVQQSQLISRAFGGGRSSSGILTLLNNYDVLEKKQTQINASMAKFPQAVAAQRKTAAAQLHLLESTFQVFSIRTGNYLLPPLTKFVTYVNTTGLPEVHRFGNFLADEFIPVDRIKSGFSTAQHLVSDFITGLTAPKKPAPVRLPAPTVHVPQTKIPDTLRKPFVFTTPAPTVHVPQTRIPGTLKAAAPQKSAAQKLGEQLRGLISGGIGDAVKTVDWPSVGKSVGAGLGKAVDWVVAHGADLSKKVGKGLGGLDWVDVGKQFGSVALPMAIGFVDNIFAPLFTTDFWSKHWLDTMLAAMSVVPIGKLADVGGTMLGHIPWGKLTDVLDRVPWGKVFGWARWIGDSTAPALKAASHFIDMIGTGFREGFSSKFPKIAGWFSDQLYILPDRLGDLGRLMRRKAVTLVKDVGDSLAKNVPGLGNKFVQGALKILGRFTFYQTGIHLVEGLFSGAWAQMQGVGKWAKSTIVDPVVGWVEGLFGVHSPSTVFASIGRFLILGLKAGVLAGVAGIGRWLYGTVVSPFLGVFAGAGGWLYSHGSAAVRGLLSGAWSVAKGVGGWVTSNVKAPLVGALSGPATWLYGKGRDVTTGFFSGLKQPWADVQKWVSGVAGWIKANKGPISLDRQLLVPAGQALMHGLLNGLKVGFKGVGTFVHSAGSTVASTVSRIAGSIFGGGHNDLVGQWATDVRTVLGMLGAPLDAVGPVLQRIRIESGGNPNAINLTDSNAKAGHPSQGLMQTIPSTFKTYAGPFKDRGITDPMASIYAGVNYAMHRYGSDWVSVMTRPGGYAKGGLAQFGETAWVGEKGPELMQVTAKGTRIYNNRDSMALAAGTGIRLPGYAGGTVAAGRIATAQHKVSAAEAALTRARHLREAAHTRAQRRADQLLVEAAQRRLTAARAELAAAKRYATATTTIGNTLANGLLKTLETGTAAGIAAAVKSLNSQLQRAGLGGMVAGNNRTAGRLGALANRKAAIAAQISAAKGYAADKASSLQDFLSVGDTSATTVQGLIAQMSGQQRTARGFDALVEQLSKRGLNKNLLSQLADQGPGGSLQTLFTNVSAGDIKQLNALSASGGKLATSFGNTMADAMYDSGAQAGKGFLTGLIAQEAALQKEMDRLALGMVNTIEKRLGIHSPSTVARDRLGKQFARGLALGVRVHAPAATREAQRMADTMAAVRARSVARPAGAGRGAAAAAVQEVHVHVHFQDEALRDLIDVRIEPKIKASEKRAAFRAKVGSS